MKQYFLVGTYTEPILFGTGEVFHGKGKGIYRCVFEDEKITILNSIPLRNPSFLCMDEKNKRIYAVNELKEWEGEFGGGVTELSYTADGEMTAERSFGTAGTDPCHIITSPDKKTLVISNFASGSVTAFPLNEQGKIQPDRQLFQHEGKSVHPIRQRSPHAHSAIFTEGNALYVPDLGIDMLKRYTFADGKLQPEPDSDVKLAAGGGPRFGEFSPDRKHFYLINEIGSSITHFIWNGEKLSECETLSTLPEDFAGDNICSDLHITPDGKYLYASNRGHDSIAVFGLGRDGELSFIERVSCEGRTPRNFAIDPTGQYVFVGNQDSDTIALFAIEADGTLRFVSKTDFPTPVCIRFFGAEK